MRNTKECVTNSYKIVIIGSSGVGKTAIVHRLSDDVFEDESQTTVGVEFKTHIIRINNETIKLNIWDTAGQEKFHSLIPSYIKSSTFAVFVFDITSKNSFDELENWYKMVTELANPMMMFVGNKVDLEEQREVSTEEGKKFAEAHGGEYIETSSITPININELFDLIAKQGPKNDASPVTLGNSTEQEQPKTVEIKTEKPQSSGGCGC